MHIFVYQQMECIFFFFYIYICYIHTTFSNRTILISLEVNFHFLIETIETNLAIKLLTDRHIHLAIIAVIVQKLFITIKLFDKIKY